MQPVVADIKRHFSAFFILIQSALEFCNRIYNVFGFDLISILNIIALIQNYSKRQKFYRYLFSARFVKIIIFNYCTLNAHLYLIKIRVLGHSKQEK